MDTHMLSASFHPNPQIPKRTIQSVYPVPAESSPGHPSGVRKHSRRLGSPWLEQRT